MLTVLHVTPAFVLVMNVTDITMTKTETERNLPLQRYFKKSAISERPKLH